MNLDNMAVLQYPLLMKTTIDLPGDLLHRAKITAARRKTTLKDLVQTGLNWVLHSDNAGMEKNAALARLQKGLHLGGTPLPRDQSHERR